MSSTTAPPLAGKSAIVTGAAHCIGGEIALTLARRGAKVVVHYRSRDTEANRTVTRFGKWARGPAAIGADLTDLDTAASIATWATNPRLDKVPPHQ